MINQAKDIIGAYKENCTLHIPLEGGTQKQLRCQLFRVINPEDTRVIVVNCKHDKLKGIFPDEIFPQDEDGEYRLRVLSVFVQPDDNVRNMMWLYTIGNCVDHGLVPINVIQWHGTECE
jgi:hypothetical protein